MKIRIKGNTLRLRLTKSEIEKLGHTGKVAESTNFNINTLHYELILNENLTEIEAHFKDNTISIQLPKTCVDLLCHTDTVGCDNNMQLHHGETLYILVEKDFKCIDRTDEDQSDNYEHPTQSC